MPRRCLIVERHDWETGGRRQQVQLPLATANKFVGSSGYFKHDVPSDAGPSSPAW